MIRLGRASVIVVLSSLAVDAAVLLATPTATTAQSSPPTVASKIARQHLGAVTTVISLDENRQPLALGTGFFIDQQGRLATNAHVIEGATSVIVRTQAGPKDAVRVTRFDPKYDAVVLETGFPTSAYVPIGDPGNIAVGEDVVVLGNPRGLEGTVSTGIVSALREIAGVRYLQITAPISPGSSGGPVFNANGHIIGIATATVSRGQNLNFALVANVINALPAVDVKFKAVKAAPLEANDISRWKDLVQPTNVIEDISSGIGWLQSVTFSIQNDTRVTIKDVTVLLVVRSPTGQPLDFSLTSFGDAIPPGLARQVRIPKGFGSLNTKGYAQSLDVHKYLSEQLGPPPRQERNESYSEYLRRFDHYNRLSQKTARESPRYARKGSVELRILDFKTLTAESPVEQLLRQR